MPEAVIIDSIRTPIANLNSALASVRPDDLAALVLSALLKRNQLDPTLLDEIYLGCANQAGEDNRNVARMALLLAGLPVEIPGLTVNRLCASGLAAVNLAARSIRSGDCHAIIAGGVESMSRAPYAFSKQTSGNLTVYDTSLGWRFVNPRMETLYGTDTMGLTAENVAQQAGITRQAQDAFALESHRRAIAAQDSGIFADEILPVSIPQRKGDPILFGQDEHPRRDTTLEALSKLKPAFKSDGSVTAGNASSLNDGAAGLLLMEKQFALDHGFKPLARVVTSAAVGVPPRVMGLGPIGATRKALSQAGLDLSQVGLVELNEAFAAQALAVMSELGLSPEITNVNGGAIALGHPLGCSGARILTTLLHEMARRSATPQAAHYGLATLCVGVGQGEATIIEWLD
ncbi:MAG TPA: acetyl-CoA C-acyltransferase [Anaerolineaceae bacterium]|jgi:3-oxoadipyl-CoA thiolase|nr:acetyl-CoA C-acyltransferase [Anaerolineaceae bacterium]HPT24441.1 acetyl-CoA C-acyltransferase [Anaerolineaceae bacterium]